METRAIQELWQRRSHAKRIEEELVERLLVGAEVVRAELLHHLLQEASSRRCSSSSCSARRAREHALEERAERAQRGVGVRARWHAEEQLRDPLQVLEHEHSASNSLMSVLFKV